MLTTFTSQYTCLGCGCPLPRGRGGHCDACVEWADAPPPALLDEPPGVPGEDTDPSAPPDLDPAPGRTIPGRAIARQFHRDRARFLEVLRGLDRVAWIALAECYAAYMGCVTPAHALRVWAKAVDADIALPPRAA